MAEAKEKITGEMTIAELLKIKPSSGAVLMSRGMHCLGCIIAQGETVAQAAEVHGIPLPELLEALNKA